MNKKLASKLNMYATTLKIIGDNKDATLNNIAFNNTSKLVKKMVDNLIASTGLTLEVITGVTDDKKAGKVDLAAVILTISSLLHVYATAKENRVLAAKTRYTDTDLKRLKASELPIVGNMVAVLAEANVGDMADYLLTQDMIDNLKAGCKTYTEEVPAPRAAITVKSSYNKQVKSEIKAIDNVLKNQLDNLAVTYKTKNRLFYDKYKSSRKLINIGARAEKPPVAAVVAITEPVVQSVAM